LDKRDALGYYLLLVAGAWVFFPSELFLARQLDSAYGVWAIELASTLAIIAGGIGLLVYLVWPQTPKATFELRQFQANLNRFREQPRRDELHDQLKLVYRPLMSAVLEMKEGKDAFPKAGTVGNYDNPWTLNPQIIARVVDIFEKHLALIENKQVREGWEENKDYLRKGEFWYGKEQRKWLENIERQHTLITWWLHSP
jgi:hypothetical protein